MTSTFETTSADRAAWAAALRHFLPPAPSSPFRTPGELAKALDANTVQTPALDLIDEALVDVAEGRCRRLMISLAPQEGKSQRTSRRFPTWMLQRNPNLRIAIVSYAHGVARRWGRAIRDDIYLFGERLGLSISGSSSAAHDWELEGSAGSVYCVGITGSLTSRPVDCFRGDTVILTEHGYTEIRALHESANRPRILSYNHDTERLEWRAVLATRAIPDRPVLEVVTQSGRRFTCTPDHRVHTQDGYRAASLLRPGDRLIVGWSEQAAGVRGLREGSQEPGSDLPGLLHAGPGVDLPHARLHAVRRGVSPAESRSRGEAAIRADADLLQAGMPPCLDAGQSSVEVRPVPEAVQGSGADALLAGLRGGGSAGEEEDEGVPSMRPRVSAREQSAGVLRPGMRGCSALTANGGQGQPALQGGNELRPVVQAHEAADQGARRQSVPGLLHARQAVSGNPGGEDDASDQFDGAPLERTSGGQPSGEPDGALQNVSCGTPQIGLDTVSMVRDLHGQRDTVYDLQVEGNSNFFAEEVLVHNCLIIDDPYKNEDQADSSAWRETVEDFWTGVALPRLSPGAAVVIIQTRWKDHDLTGWLQSEDRDGLWRVINIPAQADHDPNKGETDPLGREPGEYLESARGRSLEEWEQKKKEVGSRTWNALYQGRPAPASGNIFNADWWQFYEQPQWVERKDGSRIAVSFDEVIQSWDMTFKDTEGTDYVCGQVWGRRGAQAYLLDQVHDRMTFTETCQSVRFVSARWPQAAAKLVEDKANGPAVINALARIVPGLIPIEPDGSKTARAAAVSPFVEARNVFLPSPELAPWVADLIEEAKAFPHAAHDDRVDTMSQALNRLLLNPLFLEEQILEDDEDDGFSISPY